MRSLLSLMMIVFLLPACGTVKVASLNKANDLLLTHCNPKNFEYAARRAHRCPSGSNDGTYERSWRDTGKTRAKGTCQGGLAEGNWKMWYNSGARQATMAFEQGQLTGPYRFWHGNGKKLCEAKFAANKLTDNYKSWFKNGEVQAKGKFVDGLKAGCWATYHDNGQIATKGAYNQGKKVKKWRYWTKGGKKRSEKFGGDTAQGGCIF